MPKLCCPVIFGGLIFSSLLTFSSPHSFATTISPATCSVETQENGWRLLTSGCDIGQGLWSRSPANLVNSQYWVQCNYSKTIPDRSFRQKIASLVADSHYLYNDQGHFRCLIGPIRDYSVAQQITQTLSANDIKNSFIRQTSAHVGLADLQGSSDITARTSLPISEPAHIDSSDKNSPQNTVFANRIVLNSAIYAFTFNNLDYYQPITIESSQDMPPAFVKENDKYWSKVNIQTANQWCARYQLRLPSYDELKQLQTYGQRFLLRNHWPISNNYWSDTISSYSGEIQTLNLRSGRSDDYRPLALLYTTCVKKAS